MWKKGNCHIEQDFAHTSTRRASFNEQVRPANGHATVTSRRQSLFPFNDCSLFIERAHTIPRPYPGGMHASGRVPNFPHGIFVCFAGRRELRHYVVLWTRVDLVSITSHTEMATGQMSTWTIHFLCVRQAVPRGVTRRASCCVYN